MKPFTESAVLRSCLDLLRHRGVFAWRNNTAGVRRTATDGREFWSFAGLKGCSDILAALGPHGRLLAIETKSLTGKVTVDQQCFLDAVNAAGGVGVVIRDVKELEKVLDELGV